MWLADKPGEYMVSHINFIFSSSELFYYISEWQRNMHLHFLSILLLNNIFPLSALAVIEACPDKTIRKENTKSWKVTFKATIKITTKELEFKTSKNPKYFNRWNGEYGGRREGLHFLRCYVLATYKYMHFSNKLRIKQLHFKIHKQM